MSIDFEDLKGRIRGPTMLVMAPFNDSLELNIEALKENIRFSMDGGINDGKGFIICPCGGGEYVTLSQEEHKMMVETAVEVAGNKVLVVAGVQSCNYREAIKLALNAAEAGAKCVMIPPPYYHPISQEGIYRWYKVIAEGIGTKIGIMAYDQPWDKYVGGFISVPLMGKLAEIESVVAFKYSSTNIRDYITALRLYSKRFAFIDNSGTYRAIVAHVHGEVAGYVTHAAAFWPEFEAKYWSLLEQHKYEEATKWHDKLRPYYEFLKGGGAEGGFQETPPAKAALEYLGLYGGPVRPPFIELTKEQKKKFFGVLEGMGVPKKR